MPILERLLGAPAIRAQTPGPFDDFWYEPVSIGGKPVISKELSACLFRNWKRDFRQFGTSFPPMLN